MEKIASFKVNHLVLTPGVYLSRSDTIGNEVIQTYDLRLTAPNLEPVMNTAEIHTIGHLGATYLRNHPLYSKDIIYFGPMGCRTGFYLIVNSSIQAADLLDLLKDTFLFIKDFNGDIPGATPRDCGNYLDQNLPMAKYLASKYLPVLEGITDLTFDYKK